MSAPQFAKKRDAKAKNRLREIVVDEVSVVDRAANQRTFLIMKRTGDGDMTDTNTGNGNSVLLTAAAKASFVESLMKVLQPVLAVSEAIKGAEEKDDAAVTMPADLVATLKQAHDGLVDLYLTQLQKDAGDVVVSLTQVAKLSVALAEEAAIGGSITDEIKARANQMAELLKSIAGVTKSEEAPAADGATAPAPAAPASAPAPAAAAPATPAAAPAAPATPSATEQQIAELAKVVTTLATKVDTLTDVVAKGGAQAESAVKKQLSALEDSLKATRARVDKAMGAPPARASFDVSTTPVAKSDERRIFPKVYGDPIQDPEAAKA